MLHEGECEKSVIEWLKKQGYQFGVSYKIVLSDSKKIERVLNMIGKKTNVIVIVDTDTLIGNLDKQKRLKKNLLYLLKTTKSVKLITQNKNLEDELILALKLKNYRSLYGYFNATNKSTYKGNLTRLNPNKLNLKLSNMNLKLFWSTVSLHTFYNDNKLLRLNIKLSDVKKR